MHDDRKPDPLAALHKLFIVQISVKEIREIM